MRSILSTPVVQVTRPRLVTIDESVSLRVAARHLAAQRVGAAVALRGSRPVGLISERDITERLGAGVDADRDTVADAMSAPLIVAEWGSTVGEVLQKMAAEGVRHLPVLGSDGHLLGMSALAELLAFIAASETSLDLRPKVDSEGASGFFG
ncbi:MAG: CBS domain-containing protein [Actinomycetota bacterium]